MFAIAPQAVPYSDPWNLSLPQRLEMLVRGKCRIAYFYEAANNSTFRYRAYNMAQVLNGDQNNEYSASYFFQSDWHRIDEVADQADLLVICRSGYNHKINQLISKFRLLKKRVLFDIDDFVFDTNYSHLVINTLGLDKNDSRVWDDWFGMMARMGQTLRMCDGAITTNDFLAERIHQFSNVPVAVIPNFMNREQLDVSERIFQAKTKNNFASDGTITLGYFSGSPSHNFDYAIVEPALASVLNDDPRISLVLVGYISPGPELARFGHRVIRQPFHDYVNLQGLISRVEFNLMPLQSNEFTDCKSELKYFEAAAVGTLSIASPSVNYARSIVHGENGYLARAHEWPSVIRGAVAKVDEYSSMATHARKDALAKYSWENQRSTILRALALE